MIAVHAPLVSGAASVVLGLLYMHLTIQVTKLRRSHRASMGDGDGKGELAQAIRRHGNFMEYTPFAILILALAEMIGLWWPVVALAAICLIVGRLLHTRSWVGGKTFFKPRVRGMWMTFAAYMIGCLGLATALFRQFLAQF